MLQQTISQMEQTIAPFRKMGQQSLEYTETMTALQLNTLQGMIEIGFRHTRQLLDMLDQDQLQAYLDRQNELLQSLQPPQLVMASEEAVQKPAKKTTQRSKSKSITADAA